MNRDQKHYKTGTPLAYQYLVLIGFVILLYSLI